MMANLPAFPPEEDDGDDNLDKNLDDASRVSEEDAPIQLTETEVLAALDAGRIIEQGILPYSSNHSFLVLVSAGDLTLPAVYKPQQGESPLWDFEWGTLCKRETAAFALSAALGWDLVPPTVLRQGTRGLGSVQFYVENDSDQHYFTVQADARFADAFRQLALFDFVINNADRKSGHCLVGVDERIWAIDHGICFHADYKLRSVIWEFSDQPIDPDLMADLERVRCQLLDPRDPLTNEIAMLLAPDEILAMRDRLDVLLRGATYPAPSPFRRNYPWPPV